MFDLELKLVYFFFFSFVQFFQIFKNFFRLFSFTLKNKIKSKGWILKGQIFINETTDNDLNITNLTATDQRPTSASEPIISIRIRNLSKIQVQEQGPEMANWYLGDRLGFCLMMVHNHTGSQRQDTGMKPVDGFKLERSLWQIFKSFGVSFHFNFIFTLFLFTFFVLSLSSSFCYYSIKFFVIERNEAPSAPSQSMPSISSFQLAMMPWSRGMNG